MFAASSVDVNERLIPNGKATEKQKDSGLKDTEEVNIEIFVLLLLLYYNFVNVIAVNIIIILIICMVLMRYF